MIFKISEIYFEAISQDAEHPNIYTLNCNFRDSVFHLQMFDMCTVLLCTHAAVLRFHTLHFAKKGTSRLHKETCLVELILRRINGRLRECGSVKQHGQLTFLQEVSPIPSL